MQRRKRRKKILLCLGIILCVYAYLCFIFVPKDLSDKGGSKYYESKGFLSEPVEKAFDVIAFGHSGVYSGFSPVALFQEFGITSYASGACLQPIDKINKLLEEAVKYQKPKIVFLDVDCLYIRKRMLNCYQTLLAPFVYHYRWNTLKFRDFYQLPRMRSEDISKGFFLSKKVSGYHPGDYMGDSTQKPKSPGSEALEQLDRFVKICRENQIEVVFIEFANATTWTYAKHNFIQEYADKNNIDFLDMNVSSPDYQVDFANDFRDNGNHYNVYGAQRAMKYLGKYLIHTYGNILTDKRTDPRFSYWDKAVDAYVSDLE